MTRDRDRDTIRADAGVRLRGGLRDGAGRVEGDGVAGRAEMTWAARAGTDGAAPAPPRARSSSSRTAHAGCYSMSLANVLERAGVAVEQLDVQAHCNAGVGGYGLRIEPIDLGVVGVVPGVDADEFTRLAGEAERQCPVSNRLRGNVQIRVDATLRDG